MCFQQATRHTEHSSTPGASSTCTRPPPTPGTRVHTAVQSAPRRRLGAGACKESQPNDSAPQQHSSANLWTTQPGSRAAAAIRQAHDGKAAALPHPHKPAASTAPRRIIATTRMHAVSQPQPAPGSMHLHPLPQSCSITRMAGVPAGKAAPSALWRAACQQPDRQASAHARTHPWAVPPRVCAHMSHGVIAARRAPTAALQAAQAPPRAARRTRVGQGDAHASRATAARQASTRRVPSAMPHAS